MNDKDDGLYEKGVYRRPTEGVEAVGSEFQWKSSHEKTGGINFHGGR